LRYSSEAAIVLSRTDNSEVMMIDSYKLDRVQSKPVNPIRVKPYFNSSRHLREGNWVQLLELPAPFSSDEALLLCHEFGDLWVVWVPGYGETVLSSHQFTQMGKSVAAE